MPVSRKRRVTNYQRVQARNRKERARTANGKAVMKIYENIPRQPLTGSIVTRLDGRQFEVRPGGTWREAANIERKVVI